MKSVNLDFFIVYFDVEVIFGFLVDELVWCLDMFNDFYVMCEWFCIMFKVMIV